MTVTQEERRVCNVTVSLHRSTAIWGTFGPELDSPDERGLRLAARVAEIEDQREVAVVDGNA